MPPYVRTNWVDYPNLSTAINAARLNNMEAGIAAAIQPGNGQIVDADVASNAAIKYTKLALALSIMDGDVSPAAAIAISKLAGYPGDPTQILHGDGSWQAFTAAGSQLDYSQIIANSALITAITEATAVTVITGNSVTFDGSRVRVDFFVPVVSVPATSMRAFFVLLRDAVVLGQVPTPLITSTSPFGAAVGNFFDTPPAGAHIYKLAAFAAAAAGITVNAGPGGSGNLIPAYLRVARA